MRVSPLLQLLNRIKILSKSIYNNHLTVPAKKLGKFALVCFSKKLTLDIAYCFAKARPQLLVVI